MSREQARPSSMLDSRGRAAHELISSAAPSSLDRRFLAARFFRGFLRQRGGQRLLGLLRLLFLAHADFGDLAQALDHPGIDAAFWEDALAVRRAGVFADQATSDSDTLSLEARNEKEIELHPDQVTRGAELGVQKAEAAALVWSRKAVLATYAW